jgi:hypothetical protein
MKRETEAERTVKMMAMISEFRHLRNIFINLNKVPFAFLGFAVGINLWFIPPPALPSFGISL